MRRKSRERARWLCQKLAPEDYARFCDLKINDLGFGYDPFGLEIESAMLAYSLAQYMYKYWFRVESFGVEHIPEEGPALVIPNHSGVLPIDGFMIAIDIAKNMRKPRIMRAAVDNFAGFLPFINTLFYRCGQLVGARRNFEELLRRGELVAIFPEGAKGTGKSYKQRYKLRPFNVGFMELSLLFKAPIVPTAVIGAEEQYPYMINVKPLAKALRFPYFPVTPFFPLLGPIGMLPLPTKYYIYYGEPFHFYREYPPETVHNPDTIRMLVGKVQGRVEEMIEEGLRRRKGIFGFSLLPFRRLLGAGKGGGPREEVKQLEAKSTSEHHHPNARRHGSHTV
jgi:1-acyl-sn-glycerol-3-phosphate acyltransferase